MVNIISSFSTTKTTNILFQNSKTSLRTNQNTLSNQLSFYSSTTKSRKRNIKPSRNMILNENSESSTNKAVQSSSRENSNNNSFLIPEEYWKKKIQDTTWYYQTTTQTTQTSPTKTTQPDNKNNNNEQIELKLPFKCTSCGNCCRTKGEVYTSNEELTSIKKYLNITEEMFDSKYISKEVQGGGALLKSQINSASCVFLNEETNECKIYEARPFQCRTYPFWPRVMNSRDDWNNEVRLPGVDNDNDNNGNNYWSIEKGGCEGMKYIPKDDIAAIDSCEDEDDGVECSKVYDILEQMRRYEKLHLR